MVRALWEYSLSFMALSAKSRGGWMDGPDGVEWMESTVMTTRAPGVQKRPRKYLKKWN